ncbi:cell death abnormality protein 1-like isoform X4 [Ostrea edulis]|uniref:cell death abnormality protein 1-like isoform X4 n=1 Tax=Ostrea edulis TaxID=37623 RepID=UPI0024AF01AC|nr:cell death abnormality protein 1-like isoform X4 [Ostrea edulis]
MCSLLGQRNKKSVSSKTVVYTVTFLLVYQRTHAYIFLIYLPYIFRDHSIMECIIVILLSVLLVIVNTATTQKNIGETCSQCQSCPIGYHGRNCSLPCRYPSYGERCQKKCNCTAEYCTSDKGCINKTNCEPGYYGRDCSLPCRYPNYGAKCQSECNCTKTLCSHITGCQPSTDNVLIYTTTEKEKDEHSTAVKEDLQTVIVIGCSIVFGVIVLFVSIIIALVKRNKQSKRKKEQDCDFDSEFSSYQSIRSDTERSTTSGRYCRNIHELNGKQARSQELEIYENTSIQEKMRTYHP